MDEQFSSTHASRRRRRNNVEGARQRRIVVKVTADEEDALRARADRAGVSVQRLMVARALRPDAPSTVADHTEKVRLWSEATEVRNLLGALSVNMNQIARHANTEREVPVDFAAAVAATRDASHRVRDAFGNIFNVKFPSA
ncbi:hypothetical protein A5788_00360 [Gordonia sp. 852002-50816_SCH5313054-c]|uniref:plasmid mobilization protein n=1 Tax=unclassified Gordonia (in: high G+C Gram-positive bacteria) TaxID=2657482 RepID=UPI0007E9EC7B|nr:MULTISPECIES: hypothetical protein [unclassified Gordonia (in: high G+C Gram-positive bacteria)]OBC13605.1 hypothetical protein A5786_23525 [Gordonia sp. 852002-50816_SCH5313054-a]OBC21520.1 hypothetical protein A5788_00360 [Gordonia sp. 852002-50816_SCH5313054-c]